MQYSNTLNGLMDEDYHILQNEYSGTEQLHEILHFLNLAFPKWKTHKGLGVGAPEFVLWVIDHTKEDCDSCSMREYLKILYTEIADTYESSKEFYASAFKENCFKNFIQMDDDFFFKEYRVSIEHLNDHQINGMFENYYNERVEEEPFNFTFEEDIPWELAL